MHDLCGLENVSGFPTLCDKNDFTMLKGIFAISLEKYFGKNWSCNQMYKTLLTLWWKWNYPS